MQIRKETDMPTFSSSQIPPPTNWQDFEILCCDLWQKIWNDPNTLRNGRQGQSQCGVDIYGRPNQKDKWAGVQCKGRDNFAEKSLTKEEVRVEVEEAKSFRPKLSEFIIATTGQKDAKLEKLAREITEEHLKIDLFSVHIWSWGDIFNRLADYPDIIEKHYPWFLQTNQVTKGDFDEMRETQQTILSEDKETKSAVLPFSEKINTLATFHHPHISMNILTPEYQAELDYSRDILNDHKPKEALDYLEKLKKRIWSDAPSIVKYRILTNTGSAKLNLDQEKEAAKLFIEALQYNTDDEKALCNAALGHLILGQTEKANELANQVLEKNPANSYAYSIIIKLSSKDENMEVIISKVPESYRNSWEIAYAIGNLAMNRGELYESKKWLEIAIENDREYIPDLRAALGDILLAMIIDDESVTYGNQINDAKKDILNCLIGLFTFAWDRVKGTDLEDFRRIWILKRALAKRYLGDIEGLISDIDIALSKEPSNPQFIKFRALLALEYNDNKKAIELLEKIQSSKEIPEAPLLLAEVLRKEKKSKEAISIIIESLKNMPTDALRKEANRLLIQLYIDIEDIKNAREISDLMRITNPTEILVLVDAARIFRSDNRSDDAISALNEAKRYIVDSSSFRQLLELADEFYELQQFGDAASIYEKITDTTLNTPLTNKLLNSYYRDGDTGKALDLCQKLRRKYGPSEYISKMESAIYEEIGNLPEARRVCRDYLDLFPDDFGMKLRLAIISFRSGDYGVLDAFLNSPIDTSILSLEYSFQLAYLYAIRNLIRKSFEAMYEARRRFFNKSDVHLKYIIFFLQNGKNDEWLNPTKISIDTAICIEDESNQKEWYIIEDRKNPDISHKEINLEHPLTKKLLGKSVEDIILLKENHLSKSTGKIIEIKSKYVYVLHESLSIFDKLFPDTPGLWKIKIRKPEGEGSLPKGFENILDQISKQHETYLKVEELYKKDKLTIGAFANLVGRNVLDVWNTMINKPDLGLKSCIGNTEERYIAFSMLKNKPKLIADIISLMTLYVINAGDVIVGIFGKLGIAQSTIDLLQHTLDERKGIQQKGFMTIGKEGEEFVRQEIKPEDIKRNIEFLEGIIEWIKGNCEILPIKAALNIKRTKKEQFNELLGSSFIDTILIASESGNLLYSDDERLRSFAKGEFNVDGVWTQVLLLYCLHTNALKRNNYNEMIIKLISFNYHYTSIDAAVLIEAAQQSNWLPSYSFITVLQSLGGKYSEENSMLMVVTNFLFELWKQPIPSAQREYLILSLLEITIAKRYSETILDKLIVNIKNRFSLLPLAERKILSLIELWKQMHII